jgi:hypothetical protein
MLAVAAFHRSQEASEEHKQAEMTSLMSWTCRSALQTRLMTETHRSTRTTRSKPRHAKPSCPALHNQRYTCRDPPNATASDAATSERPVTINWTSDFVLSIQGELGTVEMGIGYARVQESCMLAARVAEAGVSQAKSQLTDPLNPCVAPCVTVRSSSILRSLTIS